MLDYKEAIAFKKKWYTDLLPEVICRDAIASKNKYQHTHSVSARSERRRSEGEGCVQWSGVARAGLSSREHVVVSSLGE